MEEWKEYSLGDLVELKNGVAFKSSEFIESGIPVIKIKNVKPNKILLDDLSYVSEQSSHNRKCFDVLPSDILITMTGNRKDGGSDSWVGKVALFGKSGRYLLNQRVSAIRVKRKDIVDYRYLAYLLSCWDAQLYFVNHSNSSGGQANISPDVVFSYNVTLPSLSEQNRIAVILKSLDDKIELNRRINDNFYYAFLEIMLIWILTSLENDNLEQQAQALFKLWFVDFEPFRDQPFMESEMGMIPQGWRVGTLSDLGEIVGGSTPSKAKPEYYTDNGIAWLTPKDLSVSQCKFTSKGEIDITQEGYGSCSTKLMPKGTVLFSSRAPIGYITIAKNDICTNQGFKSVIPTFAGTAFIYCFLKEATQEIENKATGSTFKEASGNLMKSLPAIIPERVVLDYFEELMRSIFKQQEVVEEENFHLVSLRDTLLPKLMSGELNIENVNV